MKESKGQDKCEEEKKEAKEIGDKIKGMEVEEAELKLKLDDKVKKIGNLVHDSVIADGNEDNNEIVQTWGVIEENKIDGSMGHLHHHQIM